MPRYPIRKAMPVLFDSPAYWQKVKQYFDTAYWPLWEASGAVANDISGNARHLDWNGSVTLGQAGIGDGKTSALLDGSSAYAERTVSENIERGPNLIVNGGFETYTGTQDNGTNVTYPSWTPTGTGSNHYEATATAHAGDNALKLVQVNANASETQVMNVTPGSYEITMWVTGDGTNAGRFSVQDVTHGTNLRTAFTNGVTGTDYAKFSYVVVAPAGCLQISLTLWTPGVNGSYCRFDNVQVRRLNDISISLWVKRAGEIEVVRQYPISRMNSTDNRMWFLRFWGTGESNDPAIGKLSWGVSNLGTTNNSSVTGTTVLTPGQWYHVLVTYKPINNFSSLGKLYVDGVLEAEASNFQCPIFEGTPTLRLGATQVVGSEHYLSGNLAHVGMSSSLLDAYAAKLARA